MPIHKHAHTHTHTHINTHTHKSQRAPLSSHKTCANVISLSKVMSVSSSVQPLPTASQPPVTQKTSEHEVSICAIHDFIFVNNSLPFMEHLSLCYGSVDTGT